MIKIIFRDFFVKLDLWEILCIDAIAPAFASFNGCLLHSTDNTVWKFEKFVCCPDFTWNWYLKKYHFNSFIFRKYYHWKLHTSTRIGFTENLSLLKFLKIPHCAINNMHPKMLVRCTFKHNEIPFSEIKPQLFKICLYFLGLHYSTCFFRKLQVRLFYWIEI